MKVVGIIPARYNSTRFPGKILEKLDGRPLLWHVFTAAAGSSLLDQVYVATDSDLVRDFCLSQNFPCLMTGSGHQNPTSRVWEAACQVNADLYVMIGGDEPLISSKDIDFITEKAARLFEIPCDQGQKPPSVVNAMAVIHEEAEISDPANIKIVCDETGRCLYASRNVIPSASNIAGYPYRKFVSIGVYPKSSLDLFVKTEQGILEKAENFDLLRFIEHGCPVVMADIKSRTLSVDMPADLERVRHIFLARASKPLT